LIVRVSSIIMVRFIKIFSLKRFPMIHFAMHNVQLRSMLILSQLLFQYVTEIIRQFSVSSCSITSLADSWSSWSLIWRQWMHRSVVFKCCIRCNGFNWKKITTNNPALQKCQ